MSATQSPAIRSAAADRGALAMEAIGLGKDFKLGRGAVVHAVRDVSFGLYKGSVVALVGESGSGKSTAAKLLAGQERPTAGTITIGGQPIAVRSGSAFRRYKREVQYVFQDPFASLNPVHTVGYHLARPIRLHQGHGVDVPATVMALLEQVRLTPAEQYVGKYPHELSGGQRQRVAFARALAAQPSVLLADEPVSMLDVSIRLEIMNLLDALKRDRNLALLYITHDLATARHFSARVMVMYRGEIVEQGPADEVILNPAHPYTQLLESAVPRAAADRAQVAAQRRERLRERKAASAALATEQREATAGTGCQFRARCPHAMEICATRPPDFEVKTGHIARCWLHDRAPVTKPVGR
jgi:peptide/nickel transport system ATP-binding protein